MTGNSPKLVSLRPENNYFLNIRIRFYLNTGKSLRQSEKIYVIEFWKKSAKENRLTSSQWGLAKLLQIPKPTKNLTRRLSITVKMGKISTSVSDFRAVDGLSKNCQTANNTRLRREIIELSTIGIDSHVKRPSPYRNLPPLKSNFSPFFGLSLLLYVFPSMMSRSCTVYCSPWCLYKQ